MSERPTNQRRSHEADLERELVRAALSRNLFGLPPNSVRRGRFELLRALGRGAMGVVYEALDVEREERVALKCLTRLDARAIQRLKREFRSLSAMHHPALVRLDELFHQDGQWFFSMELVDGKAFDSFVHERNDPRRLDAAFGQLVGAVAAIHAAGKLHRDLKPSNVLVTDEGRVVVLDFGLVFDEQFGADAMSQSEIVGTPAYLAPELASGSPATRESDWYAVGVMLFQALTGRLPFEGPLLQILSEKQRREAPDPRLLAPGAAPHLSDLCIQLLHRSPSARPGSEQLLCHFRDDVGADEAVFEPAKAAPSPTFIGRTDELQALRAARTRAEQGRAQVALVHSASGVGKSALLERFAQLSGGHALVLRGRCHQQESVPYKVFDGVMDAIARYLADLPASQARALLPRHLPALLQLFPALGAVRVVAEFARGPLAPGGARDQRNQAFAAFKELLLRISDRVRVTLLVDDLQWGDVDSAHMLASVLGPPEPAPLLFIGAYRSDEASSSEFLTVLLKGGLLPDAPEMIALEPLSPEDARELARSLLDQSAEDLSGVSADIARESSGVPFFITELTRHVGKTSEERAQRAASGLSLERLVLARISPLPAGAQLLLKMLSVAGSPLELDVALDAAGLGRSERHALSALRTARLARLRQSATGELAETYHDRIREAVVESMSEGEVAAVHQALATALERSGVADPDRLVLHYSGAGDRVRAGQTAFEAGVMASQKLAFNHAVQLFRHTLALLPLPGCSTGEVLRRLGDALASAGQGIAAGEAYLKAAEHLGPSEKIELQALAAVQYLGTPRMDEGRQLANHVLASVGVHMPQGLFTSAGVHLGQRAGLHVQRFAARTLNVRRKAPAAERMRLLRDIGPAIAWGDGFNGLMLHTLYLRDALAADDKDHLLTALASETMYLAMGGGRSGERRALEAYAQLTEVAERVGTRRARALVHMAAANRLQWAGRAYADAVDAATKAAELLADEPTSSNLERTSVAVILLLALDYTGELARVRALSDEYQRDARERQDQFIPMMLTSAASQCHLCSDHPGAALELLETMRPSITLSMNFQLTWVLRMTEALGYAGRPQHAFELMETHWPTLRKSYTYFGEYGRYTVIYYRARSALAAFYATGDRKAAHVARRMSAALPDDASSHGAYRAALLASLHEADGDRSEALRLFELSRSRFLQCQAKGVALHAERSLHQLQANRTEIARIDDALSREGVKNPERWVWTFMPLRNAR